MQHALPQVGVMVKLRLVWVRVRVRVRVRVKVSPCRSGLWLSLA